jgi:arsenate reductase
LSVRDPIRTRETAYREPGLGAEGVGDAAPLDAMVANPVLLNRPFVVTPKGVRRCRPAERVDEIR